MCTGAKTAFRTSLRICLVYTLGWYCVTQFLFIYAGIQPGQLTPHHYPKPQLPVSPLEHPLAGLVRREIGRVMVQVQETEARLLNAIKSCKSVFILHFIFTVYRGPVNGGGARRRCISQDWTHTPPSTIISINFSVCVGRGGGVAQLPEARWFRCFLQELWIFDTLILYFLNKMLA